MLEAGAGDAVTSSRRCFEADLAMIADETRPEPAVDLPAGEASVAASAPAEPPRRRFEDLPPAAQRALLEAEDRRRAADAAKITAPKEIAGRDGPEPVRYGDWEKKGIICDF